MGGAALGPADRMLGGLSGGAIGGSWTGCCSFSGLARHGVTCPSANPHPSQNLVWHLSCYLIGIGSPLSAVYGASGRDLDRISASLRTRFPCSGHRLPDSGHSAHGESAVFGNGTAWRWMFGSGTGSSGRGPHPRRRCEGQPYPAHRELAMKFNGPLSEFPEVPDGELIDRYGICRLVVSCSPFPPSWANGLKAASTIRQFVVKPSAGSVFPFRHVLSWLRPKSMADSPADFSVLCVCSRLRGALGSAVGCGTTRRALPRRRTWRLSIEGCECRCRSQALRGCPPLPRGRQPVPPADGKGPFDSVAVRPECRLEFARDFSWIGEGPTDHVHFVRFGGGCWEGQFRLRGRIGQPPQM